MNEIARRVMLARWHGQYFFYVKGRFGGDVLCENTGRKTTKAGQQGDRSNIYGSRYGFEGIPMLRRNQEDREMYNLLIILISCLQSVKKVSPVDDETLSHQTALFDVSKTATKRVPAVTMTVIEENSDAGRR